MAWHSDEAVENNLRKCYEVDIDWDLVPKKLQDVSIHCFLTITAQWLCVSSIFSSNYCLNIIFFPLLQQLCEFWGKTMKQRKTTVLLGILSLVSFMLGHASLHVKDGWEEPIVLWMAVVLKTGISFSTILYSFIL
jgi:hypothetical protein